MPPMDMGRRWCAAAVDHGQICMVIVRRSEILESELSKRRVLSMIDEAKHFYSTSGT